MKPVNRYVPLLAFKKIEEKLIEDEPLFRYEKEVFYFIIDLFYRLKVYNKNIKYTEQGLIRISSKYFGAFITKGYANYIRWLIKHEIIICDKIKKVGKAYGYELHSNLESKLISVKIPGDKIITRRIIENFNKRQKFHKKQEPHFKTMKSYFKKNIGVNLMDALSFLESELKNKTISLSQFNVYYLSIQLIDDKEIFFKQNNVNGRLDSNLTNLKSELRKYIPGNWKQIDCKNSQPLIVNFITNYIIMNNLHYINNNNILSPPPLPHTPSPPLEDEYEKILRKQLNYNDLQYLKFFPNFTNESLIEFTDFRRSTFSGDFYNILQQQYENLYHKSISREDVKEIVYKVFFSKNSSYGREKAVFRRLYPTIYEIIFQLKKEKHNKFALLLQTIESEIFIERISKKLVENGIIPLTIHDSIIVLEHEQSKALEIISSIYQELMQSKPDFVCENL